MPTSIVRLLAAPALVVAAIAACTGKDPYNPGTPLGSFHVIGKLQSNGCGGTAPDPWEFDVKLSKDHNTLYWLQGGLPVQGTLDANAHVAMTSQAQQTVRDDDGGPNKCALTRDDALAATLVADPADATAVIGFTGSLAYTFGQTADSDCSDQLTAAGGGFAALPCTATYAIVGHRSSLPAK